MNKLVIIVPTYNRKANISYLLKQLYSQSNSLLNLEIVVVIDGSNDGTEEYIVSYFPEVHIIKGDGTWWYTRSMNEGFKYAIKNLNCRVVLCMNDDITISENYIQNILDNYNTLGNNSIIGSLALDNKTKSCIAFAGIENFNRLKDKMYHYYPILSKIEPNEFKGLRESELLPGRGLLIPIEAIKKLNGFDPFFFQYQSDYDFCLRARKIGYRCYISYDAVLYSNMELTSNVTSYKRSSIKSVFKAFFQKTSRIFIPNRARFYWKHYLKIFFPFYMLKFFIATLYKNTRR
jgi:GT2 family glycosyltransferase